MNMKTEEEIRQEAIKWIKDAFQKEIKEVFGNYEGFKSVSGHTDWSFIKKHMKDWNKWIQFFNITEEDL